MANDPKEEAETSEPDEESEPEEEETHDTDPLYPTAVTKEEAAAGFRAIPIPRPAGSHPSNPWVSSPKILAAVRTLSGGRRVVKIARPGGGAAYAVQDANGRLLETAYSVDELMTKYPHEN